jgi:hypothetical protein
MMERRCRGHNDNVGDHPCCGDQVVTYLDLKLCEFIDQQEVDTISGDATAREKPAWPYKAHDEIAVDATFLTAFKREHMAAAKQFFFPLRYKVIRDNERGSERPWALRGQRAHHHDRLNRFAETDLVGEQPAAGGARDHPVYAVYLMCVSEGSYTERAEQGLVTVDPSRCGV